MNNPKQVGQYQIVLKLGQGSFGKVYKGIHIQTKEEVALKFIGKRGTKQSEIKNILAENEILKKINHQNIIRFIDCIDTTTDIVIVMDYAGVTLQQVFEKDRKFSYDEIKNYSQQIFSAMWYLSENRITHRDLKPQNILIKDGKIKLCDFGFAKQLSASTKFMESLRGTPLYIAPEIINKEQYTQKVDVWSFGVIIYEFFCGRSPFLDVRQDRVFHKINHLKVRYPPTMPNQLKQVLSGMLQKNPVNRFSWQKLKTYSIFNKPQPLNQLSSSKSENQQKKNPSINVYEDIQCMKKHSSEQPEEIIDRHKKIQHLTIQDSILQEIKQLEAQIKSGKVDSKKIKTDSTVLEKVMTILRSSLAKQGIVEKQHLQYVYSLMSFLVTKVKLLTAEDIQKDITKDKQLLFAIIKIAQEDIDSKILASQFVLIGFLIKNNFDSVSIDFETQQFIVDLCLRQIKQQRSRDCLNHALRIMGILANQAMVTLKNSKDFFFRIDSCKALNCIAECFEPSQERSLVIQCLQKFIHPNMSANIQNDSQLRNVFKKIKEDVGNILANKKFVQENPVKIYQSSQTRQSYARVCYECLRYSDQFRRQFMKQEFWPQFINHKSLRIFSLSFDYICIQKQKIPLLPNDVVHQKFIQCSTSGKMQNVFLIARAAYNLVKKQASSKKIQHAQSLLLQIAQLLTIEQDIKSKACRQVEGFLCFGDRIFQNTLGEAFCNIMQDPLLNKQSIDEGIILSIFKRLLNFKHPHEQLRLSLEVTARCLIVRDQLLKINMNRVKQDKQHNEIIYNLFHYFIEINAYTKLKCEQPPVFMRQLIICFFNFTRYYSSINEKGQMTLYRKAYDQDFQTLIFSEQIRNEKMANYGLNFVLKICSDQKYIQQIADIIVIVLPKMKPYLKLQTTQNQLIVTIIQSLTLLTKKNQIYSQQVKKFEIISHLPRYLKSDSQTIVHQSLNLIGNLSKHSVFFFDEFQKHLIFRSMRLALQNMGYGNKNRVIKGLVYAIGNISFYDDRFSAEIKPLVGNLAAAITSDENYLVTNALSTISNLLRHSDIYIQCLVEHKIIKSVIEIVLSSNSQNNLVSFALSLLKKALNYQKIFKYHRKQEFINIYDKKCQIFGEQHDFMKKVKNL